MLTRFQFGALLALGIAALALVSANIFMTTRARAAQVELAERQQFIQQSVALENLYRDIVKALAELGTKGGDRQLLEVLTSQGINVTFQPTAPAASASDSPAKGLNRK